MANLTLGEWTWQYASQSTDILQHLENELTRDDWLFRQPAKEQTSILQGAPKEFVQEIIKKLKPETAISLGYNPFA